MVADAIRAGRASAACKRATWIAAGLALTAIVACGGGPSLSSDAGAIATTTVKVVAAGAGVEGIDVVFHDGGGRVVAHTKTGRDGAAATTIASVAAVTVARVANSGYDLLTVLGVEAGDNLEVQAAVGRVALAEVVITLPGPFAGATGYEIGAGCTSAGRTDPAPLVLTFYDDCQNGLDGPIDVLALAQDASGGNLAWTAGTLDLARAGGQNLSLPPWRTELAQVSLGTTGMPPDVSWFYVRADLTARERSYFVGSASAADGMNAAASLAVPVGFGDGLLTQAWTNWWGVGFVSDVRRSAPVPAELVIDPLILPLASGARIDRSLKAQPAIGWATDETLAASDALIVRLSWEGLDPHMWQLVAPASVTPPLVAPELPDALALWRIAAADVDGASLLFIDRDDVDGYPAVRVAPDLAVPPEGALVERRASWTDAQE